MNETDVVIGTVWFVWGDHQKVVAERPGRFGREVRLERVTRKKDPKQPWVEARRVAKHGKPSEAYSERSTA